MVRPDGRILIGLQTRFNSGDLAHDLGAAFQAAVALKEKGEDGLVNIDVREPAPRIQELLAAEYLTEADADYQSPLEITPDFGYWFDPNQKQDADTLAALEQNRLDMVPTEEIPGAPRMYWCEMNNNFVRYVTNADEDAVFTALAKVQTVNEEILGKQSRFVGAFRACGLTIPVFEVSAEETAQSLAKPAAALQKQLDQALADDTPLSDDQKRIRAGLVSRQVTIR